MHVTGYFLKSEFAESLHFAAKSTLVSATKIAFLLICNQILDLLMFYKKRSISGTFLFLSFYIKSE